MNQVNGQMISEGSNYRGRYKYRSSVKRTDLVQFILPAPPVLAVITMVASNVEQTVEWTHSTMVSTGVYCYKSCMVAFFNFSPPPHLSSHLPSEGFQERYLR